MSDRRRSPRKPAVRESERAAEIAREEHADFSRVRADQRAFDAKAFEAALRHRQSLTPEDELFEASAREAREKLAVVRDDGGAARVRSRRASAASTGLVAEVEVTMDAGFAPATLVIPVDAKRTRDVHPATLEIMRWDEASEAYRPLGASGLDLTGGYAWARITRPGGYAVIGLPLPHVLHAADDKLETVFARAMSGWEVIIIRTFVPDGPWEPLGPSNLSCCVFDVAVEPGTDRLYAAASDGGVWRLNSVAGYPHNAWRPVADDQPSLQINCVGVSPADHSVVFYADRSGRLFRSTDRGTSWSLRASGLGGVHRLAPHPTDADTLYLATDGGLRCTTDGGTTWRTNSGQSSLRDGDITDVVLDPGDPTIVYAAERFTGVVKSTDAGGTWGTTLAWSRATSPAGSMIKLGIGAQGTPATRTVVAKLDQEVWLTRDAGRPRFIGGSGWTSKGTYGGTGYGDWCHVVAVDPFDDDVILAGGQQLYRTGDGGTSWTLVVDYYRPHEDQHRVVFDPATSGVVYLANDGGVFRSTDGGATWQTGGDDIGTGHDLTIGLQTAQFYTSAVSGDHAIGDVYHQGLIGANWLARLDWSGIEGHAWEFNNVAGDPVRHGTYYVFGGQLFRRTFPSGGLTQIGTFTPTAIAACPESGSTTALAGDNAGAAWVTSDISATSPTWSAMSGKSGADTIASIAFAPSSPRRAYALTNTGRVFTCANAVGSPSWTARTSLPAGSGVALAVDTANDQLVYAIDGAQAYRSSDGAGSWSAVPGTSPATLPPGAAFVSIAAGPGTVYVATTGGVFRSPDAGAHWFDYSDGLPNVELKELLWTDNDLFAVTHGRGLWHHGRYSETWIPPRAHIPDIRWLIELWLAIHGGDPAPEIIRGQLGRGITPFERRS